jgi:hypothetical protein
MIKAESQEPVAWIVPVHTHTGEIYHRSCLGRNRVLIFREKFDAKVVG